MPAEAEEKALAAEMTARRQAFLNEAVQPLLSALRAQDKERADQLTMTVMTSLFAKLQESATALAELQAHGSQREFEGSQENFRHQLWWTGCIGLLMLLLMVVGSVSLLRSILCPITRLMQHFQQIAEGDLSGRIVVQGKDEMSVLMQGL